MLLPDSGKVTVDGDDTSDEDKTFVIREKVGLVLQNPDNQLVASIVEDAVQAFGRTKAARCHRGHFGDPAGVHRA